MEGRGNATTAATDISAAMRPYPIAVAPYLFLIKLLNLENMFVIPMFYLNRIK